MRVRVNERVLGKRNERGTKEAEEGACRVFFFISACVRVILERPSAPPSFSFFVPRLCLLCFCFTPFTSQKNLEYRY